MKIGDLCRKAAAVYRREGFCYLATKGLPFVHDRFVRPALPRVFETTYNGITVRSGKPLDGILPWIDDGQKPSYESALVDAIQAHVRSGDDVVVIGGGWGVTATHAARHVGEDGEILVYEGAATEVRKVRETARRNGLADRIEVEHAIVGPAISLRGGAGDADSRQATELSSCEVLLMDCEGAETTLLQDIVIEPRVIAVESHGHYDASSDQVAEQLRDLGYEVVSKEIANEESPEICIDRDIYVLVGVDPDHLTLGDNR
jgi:hypothetical protein